MSADCPTVDKQIELILQTNQVRDLCGFIKMRHFLNRCNFCMIYLFHIMQTTGILITTVATGSDMKVLMWVGIAFHCTASLVAIFEKNNVAISKKLLHDIEAIKSRTYVDESPLAADIEAPRARPTPHADPNADPLAYPSTDPTAVQS
jgi:hypothetical protein